MVLIDRFSDSPEKALFFVNQIIANGWSRDVLRNFIDTDLYDRQGILRKEGRDNPTIGILICKEKDNLIAQYSLEASNLPLVISEYELARLYPEKIDGTIPTPEDLEKGILPENI